MGGVLFPSQIKNKNTNVEKIKSREEVGLGNNIKLSNKNKKIDTSFDTTKIIDKAKADKKIDSQVDTYVNKNKSDKPINKDLTIDKSAEGKAKYDALKQKRLDSQKPEIKKPEISKFTKQGKERTKAQMMAAKRIASGKSIQDVKDANTASMKAKAAERFKDFKAKREAGKMNEDVTPYDIVLEYLLSSEQVATIEEANYVMTEMDAETIQAIVKEGSMDVPPDVKAAAKRQYKAGSPGAEPYTVDDKKTIINYYKNKKGKV